MSQTSSVSPSSFNVTCPGCGQRLRFSVMSEMPPRLRIQCSSCNATFGVRRPGVEPAQPSVAGSLGESPPTYLAFPVSQGSVAGVTLPKTPSVGPAAVGSRAIDEPCFPPDSTIAGRYRVVRFIARGGMGEVYEVEDQELRERVAMKTVRPEAARDATAIERFRREIQLARKVTHPNVCRIFDVGSSAGTIFLTMELLAGETLAQRLRRGGPMSAEEALPIARQIADALDAAHRAGVVHRDLKPGNVMLAESRGGTRAVVTDFGLARLEAGGDAAGLTLTAAAAVVGTPAYLAPEQVEGSEITAATDVYAFGIVLYEMLTGTVPFIADNALSTAVKRLREAPVPPRVHVPGLDPRWEAAILRCLEREPAARFASAPEVIQAIVEPPRTEALPRPSPPPTVSEPAPAAEPPGRTREAKRRRLQIAGLAALILVALAVGYYRYGQWRAEQAAAPGRRLALPNLADMTPRKSVAVLGFKNLSGDPGTAWLSSALAEMLSTDLAAGGGVRVIAGENVARARVELGVGATDALARDTLARLHSLLGTDAVVLGSYVALGGAAGRQIRLDLHLQDTAAGETTATVSETGSEGQLFDLVSRVGKRLRHELGVEEPADGDAGEVRAAVPASPEAARLYAEGLERLRLFDPAGAAERLSRAVATEPGNALCHSALGAAWSALGYDGKAREEAKKAFDLAAHLPREEKLLIEGRYREATQDWERAVQTYWTLWSIFPDSLDHGLRLAAAQTSAGRVADALVTTEALRTLPAPSRDDPRIDLAEATAAGARADFERQRAAAARAAAKGKAQGAPLMLAQAKLLECRALRNLGRPDAALAACEEGRRLHAAAGNRAGVAESLTHAANVLYDRGDLPGARGLYEQALATYREIGNRGGTAAALNNIAVVLKNQGDLEQAQQLYQEVLDISREVGSRGGEAYALNNLAGVALRRGKLDDAAKLLEDSLTIRREQQDRAGEASALDNLGVALRRKGDLAGARQRHETALAIRRQIGQKIGEVASLNNLGSVLLDQGELAAARRSFESALALSEKTGNKSAAAYALHGLGEVLAREGRTAEARQRYEQAIALRAQLGEKGTLAESQLALVTALLDAGDAPHAGELARAAAEELGRQGATSNEALALAVAALAAAARGEASQAREEIDRAMALTAQDQDLRARLTVQLAAARLRRVKDPEAALREVAEQAARAGLLELRLLADLTLAQSAPEAQRQVRLAALAQEARSRGYEVIARSTSPPAPLLKERGEKP